MQEFYTAERELSRVELFVLGRDASIFQREPISLSYTEQGINRLPVES